MFKFSSFFSWSFFFGDVFYVHEGNCRSNRSSIVKFGFADKFVLSLSVGAVKIYTLNILSKIKSVEVSLLKIVGNWVMSTVLTLFIPLKRDHQDSNSSFMYQQKLTRPERTLSLTKICEGYIATHLSSNLQNQPHNFRQIFQKWFRFETVLEGIIRSVDRNVLG